MHTACRCPHHVVVLEGLAENVVYDETVLLASGGLRESVVASVLESVFIGMFEKSTKAWNNADVETMSKTQATQIGINREKLLNKMRVMANRQNTQTDRGKQRLHNS